MPYYGKYRGTVVSNSDPWQIGRLLVRVPDVFAQLAGSWALPCVPPGSPPAMPDIGDAVWIEFERGDVDYPIWCGVFWTDMSRVPNAINEPVPRET